MPELPEVEVVRQGLADHLEQHQIQSVEVRHPRAIRGIVGGAPELQSYLEGRTVSAVSRRGKFLWLELGLAAEAELVVVVHLGMSGQMLLKNAAAGELDPNFKHLRIRAELADGRQLWFVDQRTFGYWRTDELIDAGQGLTPSTISHIARDLFDPECDLEAVAVKLGSKQLEIKKLLLNQEIVSGVGNIYADEMLWATKIHPQQIAATMSHTQLVELLDAGRDVMTRALGQGGTSFDELYVNVNGQSGYFAVSLNAYGQQGEPCARCGTTIERIKFANRSSHFCPKCQKPSN